MRRHTGVVDCPESFSFGSDQYAERHFGHDFGFFRYGEFGLGIHLCEHRSHLKPSILMRAMGFSSVSHSPLYTTVSVLRSMLLFTPVLSYNSAMRTSVRIAGGRCGGKAD